MSIAVYVLMLSIALAKYGLVIYNIDLLEDLFFFVKCIEISFANPAFIYIKHMELAFFKVHV